MGFRHAFTPVLDGALVNIDDGTVRKRAVRIESGEYTPPVVLVTDTGVRQLVEALPWQGAVRAGQMRVYAPGAPAKPTVSVSNITADGCRLTSSAFSDPNAGEPHGATRWRVTLAADTSFSSPIFDSGWDAVNLTQIDVTGLPADTDLIADVTHRDDPLSG